MTNSHPPITMDEHSCCGSVWWSGARYCDRCGSLAYLWVWKIPLSEAMARLHSEDRSAPAPEPRPPATAPAIAGRAPASAGPPATSAAAPVAAQRQPSAAHVRPPGARPHRHHEVDEAPVPARAIAKRSGFASPGAAVGLPLTVIAALLVGGSLHALVAPVVGIAAMLIVLLVPLMVIAQTEKERP